MEKNSRQRSVKIISEIHPQHHGSMSEVERMILQSKLAGADVVKVQLYSSKNIWGDLSREYLSITKNELIHIQNYCKKIGIELSASVFDDEKFEWCEEIGMTFYKIASRTVKENIKLCEKIINTKKEVLISLGMYDWTKGFPFKSDNIKYLYCISNYPTHLTELNFPKFTKDNFYGYSDHTIGIAACLHAVSLGAKVIEKHFSNNKSLQVESQKAHGCSMDFNDLSLLRNLTDSITLINSSKKD